MYWLKKEKGLKGQKGIIISMKNSEHKSKNAY